MHALGFEVSPSTWVRILSTIKEYSLTKVFTPASVTPEHFARNLGRRRPRPHHRNTGVQEETRVETEEPGHNTTQVNAGETENGILAQNEVGGSGGMSVGQGEEEAGSNSGGIKTLLNTIVTKYKKKYRKNRRGRKSGQRRQGGGRRRRVGDRRK
ncbi:hypothetical protein E2C01_097531 [Portunus trituberculatus]|uniref:Uncharacterized protein n=1 Tax=Portunus trituberculatus TaxID=210409 RepID=A0A5B7K9V5_PORTR|nr:hypothetical protein [Portunus trituberculatus]